LSGVKLIAEIGSHRPKRSTAAAPPNSSSLAGRWESGLPIEIVMISRPAVVLEFFGEGNGKDLFIGVNR